MTTIQNLTVNKLHNHILQAVGSPVSMETILISSEDQSLPMSKRITGDNDLLLCEFLLNGKQYDQVSELFLKEFNHTLPCYSEIFEKRAYNEFMLKNGGKGWQRVLGSHDDYLVQLTLDPTL